jgi:hypothetical protein
MAELFVTTPENVLMRLQNIMGSTVEPGKQETIHFSKQVADY